MSPEAFVVTGANRGIGLELVRQLLAAGRHVVATARDPERSAELSALASPAHTIAALDVTDAASVARLGPLLDLGGRGAPVVGRGGAPRPRNGSRESGFGR